MLRNFLRSSKILGKNIVQLNATSGTNTHVSLHYRSNLSILECRSRDELNNRRSRLQRWSSVNLAAMIPLIGYRYYQDDYGVAYQKRKLIFAGSNNGGRVERDQRDWSKRLVCVSSRAERRIIGRRIWLRLLKMLWRWVTRQQAL